MNQDAEHELREAIVARILEMDADTLRQLHAFISALEVKGAKRCDEGDESV